MQTYSHPSVSPIGTPRRVPSLVDGALGYPASLLLSPALNAPTSSTSSITRPSCLSRSLSCKSSSSTSSTGSNKSVRFFKQPVSKIHYTYAKENYDRAPIEVDENLALRRCREDEPRKWAENFYSIRSGGDDDEEDDNEDDKEGLEEASNGTESAVEYSDSESEYEYGSDQRQSFSSPLAGLQVLGGEVGVDAVPTLLRFEYTYEATLIPLGMRRPPLEPASSADSVCSLPSLSGSSYTSTSSDSSPASSLLLADSLLPLIDSPTCYSPPTNVLDSTNSKLWEAQMGIHSAVTSPNGTVGTGIKRASSPKASGTSCGEKRKTYRRAMRSLDESDSYGCLGGF